MCLAASAYSRDSAGHSDPFLLALVLSNKVLAKHARKRAGVGIGGAHQAAACDGLDHSLTEKQTIEGREMVFVYVL